VLVLFVSIAGIPLDYDDDCLAAVGHPGNIASKRRVINHPDCLTAAIPPRNTALKRHMVDYPDCLSAAVHPG